MRVRRWGVVLATIGTFSILTVSRARALDPPRTGEIERLRSEGLLEERIQAAQSLGNHRIDPALVYGARQRLQQRLPLERSLVADESTLAAPPPGWRGMRTTGGPKVFALLIAFSDYPETGPRAAVDAKIFGDGDPGDLPYESVRRYYLRSSYEQFDLGGTTLDWYTTSYPRSDVPETWGGRDALVAEVLDYYDAQGHDFSQYDSDGDGVIDYFMVFWTGPTGDWATFWWGCAAGFDPDSSYRVDGKRPGSYGWMSANPVSNHTIIHELGHALGLPDYYPYDGATLPGGLGGLDMMESLRGDHNAFSKYLLGWIEPTVCAAASECGTITQRPSGDSRDAVIMMPGAQPGNAFDEYFVIQNRTRTQNDVELPADGLLIWHVDAQLDATGWTFLHDNTSGEHKLLRLMEADGLEEIERGLGANAGDYYRPNDFFGPATKPSSARYDGTPTYMGILQIADASASGDPGALSFEVFESTDLTGPTGAPTAPQRVNHFLTTSLTFAWRAGNVSDPESGIAGYQLQVVPKDGSLPAYDTYDAFVGPDGSRTVTGTEGHWYRARVRARNGAGASSSWSPWSEWVLASSMPPTKGFVSGTVQDASTGTALATIVVEVFDSQGWRVDARHTDDAGAYATLELVAGVYYLRTSNTSGYVDEIYDNVCPGNACNVTSGTPVVVVAGSGTVGIDIELTRGGQISGQVTDDATGAALANVEVTVNNASGTEVAAGITDSSGRYTTRTGLPTGTYHARTFNSLGYADEAYDNAPCPSGDCSATSGKPIAVTAPNPTTGIDFALAPGGHISGLVTDAAGAPLANVDLEFCGWDWSVVGRASTNASGIYTSCALPAGTYYARTSNSQGYVNQTYDALISVSTGHTTAAVDFMLERGGIISGTVKDAAGAPLASVELSIYGPGRDPLGYVWTNASGVYATAALPSGAYNVLVSSSPGHVSKLYSNVDCPGSSCDLTSGTPVRVTAPDATTGIDFTLERGGAVSGTVTDASGAPLAGGSVSVYTANRRYVSSGTTNSAGVYTTDTRLATGTYYAVASGGSYVSHLYPGVSCPGVSCDFGPGTPISVTAPNTTTGIDFALSERGGSISGGLTASDSGAPLKSLLVLFYSADGTSAGASYLWDGTGNYTSPPLPTGTYFVVTLSQGSYLDELYNNIACPLARCHVTQGTQVSVTATKTTPGIDFALEPRGQISGVLTDAATRAPLANVTVQIIDDGGSPIATASTDVTGRYIVRGLIPGDYYAWTSNNQGYIDEVYDNRPCPHSGCSAGSGKRITVIARFVTKGIDFALNLAGQISGRVIDTAGAPLVDVDVVFFTGIGKVYARTRTDASGAYSMSLPAGTYYASAGDNRDYVTVLYEGVACPGGGCLMRSGTPINVTAPSATTGIDFTLPRGGHISGTVADTAGTPLARAWVQFYDAGGTHAGGVSTSDTGLYTSTPLPTGTYFARASSSQGHVSELYDNVACPGSTCATTSGVPIPVTSPDTTSGIDFALDQGGRISGIVRDAAGTPLASIAVRFYDASGKHAASVFTTASGDYSVGGLPTGTYRTRTSNAQGYVDEQYDNTPCPAGSCAPTSGTPIRVTAPNTTAGIDFALIQGGQIIGRVTDTAGAPLANVGVLFYDASGAAFGSGTTNSSGDYGSPALPSGRYFVRTVNSQGYVDELYDDIPCPDGSRIVTSGTPITVTAPTKTEVDFALAQAARITGRVTDTAGAPLATAEVSFYDATGSFFSSALTDASGAYSQSLPTGTYYARASRHPDHVTALYEAIACPGGGCQIVSGTPISVTAPDTTADIDFILPVGGRISGTVTNTSGAPLAKIALNFFNADGVYAGDALTDSAGHYTSTPLSTGIYFALAFGTGDYKSEVYDDVPCGSTCHPTRGRPISVSEPHTTTGIDFELGPGGRISGMVTDAAGTPLANVAVQINDADGNVTSTATDASGAYSTKGLSTGAYYAHTSNAQGYIDEQYDNTPCPGASCGATAGTPISVTAPDTTTGINFALDQGGRISGKVMSAAGVPLSGVQVRCYNAGGTYVGSGTTDASGLYVTDSGLPTGTYYARTSNSQGYVDELYGAVACPGGECRIVSGTPISVTAPDRTNEIDFVLEPGGRIAGKVTDTSGAALPLAFVFFYRANGDYIGHQFLFATSSYTSPALPASTYYVRTLNFSGYVDEVYADIACPMDACSETSGTPISVTASNTTTGIDFALARGGHIIGRVTDTAGAPLADVGVLFYDASGAAFGSSTTSSSGDHASPALPSGEYFVRTVNSQGYVDELYDNLPCPDGSRIVTSGTRISVTAPTRTKVDFALAQAGHITGRVTDTAGAPLATAEVSFYDATGSFFASVVTDASGAYSQSLPTGTYYARASSYPDHVAVLYEGVACPGGGCQIVSGTPISVAAPDTTTDIDFALGPGGHISGTVTNTSGTPLAKIALNFFNTDGVRVGDAVTDSAGRYTSTPLSTGICFAVAWGTGDYKSEVYDNVPCTGACRPTRGAPISVTEPDTTTGIDFALAQGGRISGTVTDAASTPLAKVTVQIRDDTGLYFTSTTTDASGAYSTRGLSTGVYYARTSNAQGYVDEQYDNAPCLGGSCDATSGTPISVTAPDTTTGINFALDQGSRVSGMVTTAAGVPLSGVRVRCYNAGGTYVGSGTTDASGFYVTESGLPTGTYYARTSNSQGYIDEMYGDVSCPGSSCSVAGGTPISLVPPNTTSGIDFSLEPGGHIAGKVTDASGAALPLTLALFYRENGDSVGYDVLSGSSSYTSPALPSGTYYVRTLNFSGHVDELYDNLPCPGGSCMLTSGTPISVTAPSTTAGIDFVLARGGQISGRVTDTAGTPLPSVVVRFRSAIGTAAGYVPTSSSGSYTTPILPAGTYYVQTSDTSGYIDELYDNLPCPGASCVVTTGRAISVAQASTTRGIDFALDGAGWVSGRVTNATGAPLAEVRVQFYGVGGVALAATTTDAAGVYLSPRLPTGTYYASTSNSSGYADELYDNIPCLGGSCSVTAGTSISVTAPATTMSVDFALDYPRELVVWTSASGVTVSGSDLTKTAASGWGNAGASSTRAIASGDGYVELVATETTTGRMLGLSNGDSNTGYEDIDFALSLGATGRLGVYEAGVLRGTFGNYAAGDTLRVAVVGGQLRYSRNGQVFYTSTLSPTYPLRVDTALRHTGATISSVTISGTLGTVQ